MINWLKNLFKKTILIKYHEPDMLKIEQVEIGDWIDLRAAETVELKAGESALVSLGITMKLPKGYEGWVAPRSSTFKKWHVLQTNGFGIIDHKYCGEEDIWRMPVYALEDTVISKNERICQFRIMRKMRKIHFIEVESMEEASRGGFGSTGTMQFTSTQDNISDNK